MNIKLDDEKVPIVRLFPKIINREAFMNQTHPKIHPRLYPDRHRHYWREESRRCIEGFWAREAENHYRWMNPDLYHYINHWTIKHIQEHSKAEIAMKPYLRDIEWIMSTAWVACQGFSGFTEDDEYSANYLLGKHYLAKKGEVDMFGFAIELDEVERKILSEDKWLYNSKGDLKSFIPPIEYLKRHWDGPVGLPIYSNDKQDLIILGARGLGKDLEENTVVHTETGPVPIKDISVGDKIFGGDGKLTSVISKTNHYDQLQYEVTLSDGRKVECGAGHLWNVYTRVESEVSDTDSKFKYETKSLREIYEDYNVDKEGGNKYFIEICKPVQYTEKDLRANPHYLGLWLGANIKASETVQDTPETSEHYIPDKCLYGSFNQRLAFLQGVMDLKGSVHGNTVSISLDGKEIQRTFGILLSGLGIRFKVSDKTFILFTDLPVFRTNLDLIDKLASAPQHSKMDSTMSAIVNIRPTSVKPSVCIGVDNDSKLFLAGDNYIVTHNSFYASSLIGKSYTFGGRRYYETDLFPSGGEIGSIFAGAEPKDKIVSLYDKVFFGLDNYSGGFDETDISYPPPFYRYRKGTMSSPPYVVKHEYTVYYPGGGSGLRGSRSQMHMGVFHNNPDAAVGERKSEILVEEVGLAEEILKIHANNQNVLIRNGEKTGGNLYFGTGGNIIKIHGTRVLFTNPRENGFLAFSNDWENGEDIGLFIPIEYSISMYKDENGNTDLEAARAYQVRKRLKLSLGNDTTAFTRNIMFEPIKPSDMFLSDKGKIFDQYRISERMAELDMTTWRENTTFGELILHSYNFGDVSPKFLPFFEASPITTLDTEKMDSIRGSVVFYRHPPENLSFRMKGSRFRVTYDPIKIEGEGLSLASILVYDTLYGDFAAEYIGRRDTPEEIHEIAVALGLYYQSPILYESNVPGFLNYCRDRKVQFLLYPTPIHAISSKTKNPKIKYNEVGVNLTGNIKKGAITQAQSLISKKDVEGLDLYNKARSLRFLSEAAEWDGHNNMDHMSSFLLQALWDEEEDSLHVPDDKDLKKEYEDFAKILQGMRKEDVYKRILQT